MKADNIRKTFHHKCPHATFFWPLWAKEVWGGYWSQEGHVKDFERLFITLVPPLPKPHIQMATHNSDRNVTLSPESYKCLFFSSEIHFYNLCSFLFLSKIFFLLTRSNLSQFRYALYDNNLMIGM